MSIVKYNLNMLLNVKKEDICATQLGIIFKNFMYLYLFAHQKHNYYNR